MWAAMCKCEPIVRLLIERGVDTNATDNEGETPLMWAAIHGREPIARLLVARGVDINATDNEENTALSLVVVGSNTLPSWVEWVPPKARNVARDTIVQLLKDQCDVQARGSDTVPSSSLMEDIQSRS